MTKQYTTEQKVAAFDAMMERFGKNEGEFEGYVSKDVLSEDNKLIECKHVPRYRYYFAAEGFGMRYFKDVLDHFATKGKN